MIEESNNLLDVEEEGPLLLDELTFYKNKERSCVSDPVDRLSDRLSDGLTDRLSDRRTDLSSSLLHRLHCVCVCIVAAIPHARPAGSRNLAGALVSSVSAAP